MGGLQIEYALKRQRKTAGVRTLTYRTKMGVASAPLVFAEASTAKTQRELWCRTGCVSLFQIPSKWAAPQQEAPKAAPGEPVVAAVFDELLGRPVIVEGAPLLNHGQPLYTAPQPAPAPLSDDTKRLDWLGRNIFLREMSEWDAKYGHGPDYNMWVVFSPKGVQGSARNIIDAALAAHGGK